ncbi:sensor histidine kinase [Carboxylicivirga sp. RSCT41]|uniref:sensor histidine kinase n=1 Tax=Carboxylicivirga agarovorans TaxID=3417570 RepID=UPI003D3371EF
MLQGIVLVCNPEFGIEEVIFNGFTEENFQQQATHIKDLFDPDETVKVDNFLQQLISDSVIFNTELTVRFSEEFKPLKFSGSKFNGSYFLFGLEASNDFHFLYEELMRINNDQSNYIRKILKEQFMTETKGDTDAETFEELSKLNNELANLQRELAKKNSELENLNNLKNRFLGMAAHDLRNPLGAIYNFIELIEDDDDNKLSAQHKYYLKTIQKITMSMADMVNDLLDYSVIESGYINLNFESVNCNELVSKCIELLKPFADKKNITIDIEHQSSEPMIKVDESKIAQVLGNLISNAIKYSESDSRISVFIKDNKEWIEIMVKDEGQGLSEEECASLFRAFQKTSVRTTGGESSTGLGLFISKRIVEAHQGKIWAHSQKGVGSEFSFSIPRNY